MIPVLYQDQNDETLVMLTLAGEQRAYEVLVARYEKAVVAAANSVVHSSYMAEDAAQDAFITAWMKLNILREPEKYGAWVCRIAKNCAKNMFVRMRSYLSLDVLENVISEDVHSNPEMLYVSAEEKEQLYGSISSLSEKVKQVIHLHYFEELSIAEIADRMRISEGTVKAQLHSGRKKIRKGLDAMNENANDTLVQKVMKKVEELKAWQFKNSKNGFETVYNDVLADVETLPESSDKYHALADVLLRGWWWLPGEKNDALLARISEAAEIGKNDEVMAFVAAREDEKWSGNVLIEFIRDKQIPRLEAGGFKKALASEWFWLAEAYFNKKTPDTENGYAAYEKVLTIVPPSDVFYAMALSAADMKKQHLAREKRTEHDQYDMRAGGYEYRITDGKLRRFDMRYVGEGWLSSLDYGIDDIFKNASFCDGFFTIEGLKVGESYVGSDGTILTFASDSVSADTQCGRFDGCELWVTKHNKATNKTYFKKGVGIVRQERVCHGYTNVRMLKAYNIAGGDGLLPCAAGNTWEYAADYDPKFIKQSSKFTMCHADEKTVTISYNISVERLKYDDNSWVDMIQQIRSEYFDDKKVCDVYYPIERAEALAKTPIEKAHTNAACSVARRILETDPEFSPKCTATGHWNFFERCTTYREDGKTKMHERDSQWCFELKNTDSSVAQMPILYNDVYGILHDAVDCLWSDEWKVVTKYTVEYLMWGIRFIKTEVECEVAHSITTAAGTFDNCIKLSLDIHGMSDGVKYRGGKMYYYFAPNIGIVRIEKPYWDGAALAIYELAEYEGTGEGYMPLCDGMMRRYDAIGLTDGYVGSVVYTYAKDDDGDIVIFADRCGIRNILSAVTQYSSVQNEVFEQQFWDAGNREESWKYSSLNNFNLMLHFIARPGRNTRRANRSIEINGFNMRIMEQFGDGEVPPAWHSLYAWIALVRAAAFFGAGRSEEGYEHLETALEYFTKWSEYEDGQELEPGKKEMFGDCKIIKNKGCVVFPDGTRYPLSYAYRFGPSLSILLYAMTAPRGWEWFNKVRVEDGFKEIAEKARKLSETKNK